MSNRRWDPVEGRARLMAQAEAWRLASLWVQQQAQHATTILQQEEYSAVAEELHQREARCRERAARISTV